VRLIIIGVLVAFFSASIPAQSTIELWVDSPSGPVAIFPNSGQSFTVYVTLHGLTDDIDRYAFTLVVPREISVIAFYGLGGMSVIPHASMIDPFTNSYDVSGYIPFSGCAEAADPLGVLSIEMALPVFRQFLDIRLTGLQYYGGTPKVGLCGEAEMTSIACSSCIVLVNPEVPVEMTSWGEVKALF